MKIIILGAGGIGSLAGALLSKENDVLLIGRKEHVDKIKNEGLQIKGCLNENFKVKAEEEIKEIEEDDMLILSTKATANEELLNEIKDKISESNVLLVLQNGLGNEDRIRNIINCHVIRGIITSGTTFLEPGIIECSNLGDLFIEKSEQSKKLIDIFNNTGINTQIAEDMKERVWKKVIVNCVMNTMTAILKVKNGELAKIPNVAKSIIDECVEVADKEGLELDNNEMFEFVMKTIDASAENKSSMFQDILKGRKTEIDFLNGRVVELGKEHNIKTPVNEVLVSLIKFVES